MIVARAKTPSRGLTVVAVLVCLIILTLDQRCRLESRSRPARAARSQERRLQAEWLAESGTQRCPCPRCPLIAITRAKPGPSPRLSSARATDRR